MAMFRNAKAAELPTAEFQQKFDQILPLVLEEWPMLSRDALLATAGDLSQLIDYVAIKTERTRTLTRRHLLELYQLAIATGQPQPVANGTAQPLTESATPPSITRSVVDEVLQVMEKRTDDLMAQFKRDVLPELGQTARKNVGTTVLVSLGVGFLLGLLLGGGREQR